MSQEKKLELEKLQSELQERLVSLDKDLSQSHSSDSSEQAVERENDEVVENLRHETELELAQIKLALARIETGDYGSCESCGDDINPERLNIMPYSSLCIKCAEANAL